MAEQQREARYYDSMLHSLSSVLALFLESERKIIIETSVGEFKTQVQRSS